MVLGGVLISSIGAASTVFAEGKKPTTKSITRDFIIGAIMISLVMQLLPESSTSLIQFVMGLVPLALFKGGQAGGAAAPAPFGDDIEVKVGVPRF
jgi:hypothetical membrane protein